MVKVCIGIHATEVVPTQVYLNHLSAIAAWKGEGIKLALVGTLKMKVASARNLIARRAIEEDCTHWLALDTDHHVRPEMLSLLLENADAAMVSGLVVKRGFPFDTVAFKSSKKLAALEEDPITGPLPMVLHPNSGVKEVSGCAMGCTLINLELLQKLKKPWFYDTPEKRSDLNLCRAFRDAGYRILVDTRVMVGHMADPLVVWPDEALRLRKAYLQQVMAEE